VSGQIDIGGAISAGWQDVKSNPGPLIGGMIVAYFLPVIIGIACFMGLGLGGGMSKSASVSAAPAVAAVQSGDTDGAAAAAAAAAGSAADAAAAASAAPQPKPMMIFLGMGVGLAMYGALFVFMTNYLQLGLQVARGESVSVGQILRWNPKTLPLLGAMILVAIINAIGSIVVIGGVIASILLALVPFFILDRNEGVMGSLKASFEATKPHFVNMLLFILALVVLNGVGMMALGVGLIVTMPMSLMAFVHVYRGISGVNTVMPGARSRQAA
jgi:uncharacterized membrane protein